MGWGSVGGCRAPLVCWASAAASAGWGGVLAVASFLFVRAASCRAHLPTESRLNLFRCRTWRCREGQEDVVMRVQTGTVYLAQLAKGCWVSPQPLEHQHAPSTLHARHPRPHTPSPSHLRTSTPATGELSVHFLTSHPANRSTEQVSGEARTCARPPPPPGSLRTCVPGTRGPAGCACS